MEKLPASGPSSLRNQLKAAEPNHKPELDGVRGIALLAVMLSHGGPLIIRGGMLSKIIVYSMVPGWSGVELFFVLSGFLIAGILLRTKSAENYFSSFYTRRFLRIFPIYYFALTVALIVAGHNSWWNAQLPPLIKTRIAYYFYLQNWPIFWQHHVFIGNNAFGHFWSLAVEEQFYLVCPLVIWLLPEQAILWLCGAGLVLALPLRFYMVHLFSYDFTAMTLTSSRIDGLLVGVMLAIFLRRGQIPIRWVLVAAAVGASLIAYIALFHHRELISTYFYMPTIGITGFSLLSGSLVAISQHPITWLHRMLTQRWLQSIGKYSYGMYVYHIPIYVIMEHVMRSRLGIRLPLPLHLGLPFVGLLIAITFLVSKISYDYFESRILALKIYFKPRFADMREKGKTAAYETRTEAQAADGTNA